MPQRPPLPPGYEEVPAPATSPSSPPSPLSAKPPVPEGFEEVPAPKSPAFPALFTPTEESKPYEPPAPLEVARRANEATMFQIMSKEYRSPKERAMDWLFEPMLPPMTEKEITGPTTIIPGLKYTREKAEWEKSFTRFTDKLMLPFTSKFNIALMGGGAITRGIGGFAGKYLAGAAAIGRTADSLKTAGASIEEIQSALELAQRSTIAAEKARALADITRVVDKSLIIGFGVEGGYNLAKATTPEEKIAGAIMFLGGLEAARGTIRGRNLSEHADAVTKQATETATNLEEVLRGQESALNLRQAVEEAKARGGLVPPVTPVPKVEARPLPKSKVASTPVTPPPTIPVRPGEPIPVVKRVPSLEEQLHVTRQGISELQREGADQPGHPRNQEYLSLLDEEQQSLDEFSAQLSPVPTPDSTAEVRKRGEADARLTVEMEGGVFKGIQRAQVPGQQDLVLFDLPDKRLTVSVPLDELTQDRVAREMERKRAEATPKPIEAPKLEPKPEIPAGAPAGHEAALDRAMFRVGKASDPADLSRRLNELQKYQDAWVGSLTADTLSPALESLNSKIAKLRGYIKIAELADKSEMTRAQMNEFMGRRPSEHIVKPTPQQFEERASRLRLLLQKHEELVGQVEKHFGIESRTIPEEMSEQAGYELMLRREGGVDEGPLDFEEDSLPELANAARARIQQVPRPTPTVEEPSGMSTEELTDHIQEIQDTLKTETRKPERERLEYLHKALLKEAKTRLEIPSEPAELEAGTAEADTVSQFYFNKNYSELSDRQKTKVNKAVVRELKRAAGQSLREVKQRTPEGQAEFAALKAENLLEKDLRTGEPIKEPPKATSVSQILDFKPTFSSEREIRQRALDLVTKVDHQVATRIADEVLAQDLNPGPRQMRFEAALRRYQNDLSGGMRPDKALDRALAEARGEGPEAGFVRLGKPDPWDPREMARKAPTTGVRIRRMSELKESSTTGWISPDGKWFLEAPTEHSYDLVKALGIKVPKFDKYAEHPTATALQTILSEGTPASQAMQRDWIRKVSKGVYEVVNLNINKIEHIEKDLIRDQFIKPEAPYGEGHVFIEDLPNPKAPFEIRNKILNETYGGSVREWLQQEYNMSFRSPGEAGFLRIGRREEPVRALDPEVEKALTAKRVEPGIIDRTVDWFGRRFIYEYEVRDIPEFVNNLRLAKDFIYDAASKATTDVENVLIGPQLSNQEFELFRRIVLLRDFEFTRQQGKPVPQDLDLTQIRTELDALEAKKTPKIEDSLRRHAELTSKWATEMIRREKLPAGEGYEDRPYFPHAVLDYMQGLDNKLGGLPRRLKTSYRAYTKGRTGSIRDIDTDYINMMYKTGYKLALDNYIDDFANKTAEHYDFYGNMSEKQRKSFRDQYGRPLPGRLYEIDDGAGGTITVKGWQLDPGNVLYPAKSINEKLLANAITEGLFQDITSLAEAKELIKGPMGGKLIRDILAMGGPEKTYLLPEAIADRLTRFRQPVQESFIIDLFKSWITKWKSLTLGLAGVPFQVGNLTGDLMNLYLRDIGAFRYLPSSFYTLTARNRIINLLTRGKFAPRELTSTEKTLVNLAYEQRVVQTSGLIGGEVMGSTPKPEFSKLVTYMSLPQKLRYIFDPLHISDVFSAYRESIPRFAKFMADMDRIQNGKQVLAKDIDVSKLEPFAAAGKLAREFTVDYGAVTPTFARELRGVLFPFVTFYVKNAQTWARYAVKRPGEFALKVGVPLAAMWMWNNTGDRRKIEANLPMWQRVLLHIVTGWKTDEGKPIIIALQTPVDMAARMFGLDRIPAYITDIRSGRRTPKQAALEMLKDYIRPLQLSGGEQGTGPGAMARQLLNPLMRTLWDLASNRDQFSQRVIVPPQDEGTPKAARLQIEHALEQMLMPVAQYMRQVRAMEEGTPASRILTRGAFDVKRAVGIREVDLQREAMSRKYDELSDRKAAYNANMGYITDAWIEYKATGNRDVYLKARADAAASGLQITADELRNRLTSPRVQKEIIHRKLQLADTDAETLQLHLQLERIQRQEAREAFKQLPVGARRGVTPRPKLLEE